MVISGERPWSRSDCPLLAAETRATLNDVPLERQRGMQASDDFAYNRDCLVEVSGPIGSISKTSPAASLRIWDETTSWRFEMPTAFAPRSFELAFPSQAVSKRGDMVALVWSQPSDDFDPSPAFELMRADSEPGSGTVIREIETDGEVVEFTIPLASEAKSAWNGPALLRFAHPDVEPAQGPCPVDTCHLDLHFAVPSLPITIAQ